MVHMMTDDDAQAALVLKLTVGPCVVLDEGLKIGETASLLYAVYLAFLVADAVVYHLAFVDLLSLFSVLELPLLSDVCKLCLFMSVYDLADAMPVNKKERFADAYWTSVHYDTICTAISMLSRPPQSCPTLSPIRTKTTLG